MRRCSAGVRLITQLQVWASPIRPSGPGSSRSPSTRNSCGGVNRLSSRSLGGSPRRLRLLGRLVHLRNPFHLPVREVPEQPHHTAGLQHPGQLVVGGRPGEPVEGLADQDRVHRSRPAAESARRCRPAPRPRGVVVPARPASRSGSTAGTCGGPADQVAGQLAGAGPQVEDRRGAAGEHEVDRRGRVARAVPVVALRLGAEGPPVGESDISWITPPILPAPPSQPASLVGRPVGLDPVADAGLGDGRRQVVAHGAFGQEQRAAMSATVAPSREATSTSRSRPVSGDAPPARVAAASAGSTTRSPSATRRTASASCSAGASLTTKPSAPDSIARRR